MVKLLLCQNNIHVNSSDCFGRTPLLWAAENGHTAVVYDKDSKAVAALAAEGATGANSLEDFIAKLEKPRIAWVMLPAGRITEATIEALSKLIGLPIWIADASVGFAFTAASAAQPAR